MTAKPVTRTRALTILDDGHARVGVLIAELPRRALTTRSIGGDAWAPKDLIGHLASWKEYAAEALDAWKVGRRPALDAMFVSSTIDQINIAAIMRKRRLSTEEVIRRADATHLELIQRIGDMTDARWREPASRRGRKTVEERLGGILGGPAGPFRHTEAHLSELATFVDGLRP